MSEAFVALVMALSFSVAVAPAYRAWQAAGLPTLEEI